MKVRLRLNRVSLMQRASPKLRKLPLMTRANPMLRRLLLTTTAKLKLSKVSLLKRLSLRLNRLSPRQRTALKLSRSAMPRQPSYDLCIIADASVASLHFLCPDSFDTAIQPIYPCILSVSSLIGQICLASCFVAALDKNNLVLDHGVLFFSVHLRSLFYHYPYLLLYSR